MITLEYLAEQKIKYQNKADYFESLCFDRLSGDFKDVVNLISMVEKHIKEDEDGKD